MAVSRILSGRRGDRMIIYLTRISPRARRISFAVMRRYPRNSGPAALPLFCLAPHGVFPASRIPPRAVSSYLAFSPLPVPLLPKNRRCLFCDTFRRRDFAIAAPAFFTRHVAVWCSDFPPASVAAHQRSSAIVLNLSQLARKKRDLRIARRGSAATKAIVGHALRLPYRQHGKRGACPTSGRHLKKTHATMFVRRNEFGL